MGPYTGGTVQSTSDDWFNAFLDGVSGLPNDIYAVKRYEVIRDIQFPQYMDPPSVSGLTFALPQAWGNGTATPAASTGLVYNNGSCKTCCSSGPEIFGLPHTEVVPGSVTNTGCRLRTYVYEVKQLYEYVPGVCYDSYYLGFFPTSPSNVQFAATVLGIPSQPKAAGSESTESLTSPQTPETFFIEQNYPNPFNPETEIRFGLPNDGHVQLMIIDLLGREVRRLADGDLKAGYHTVVWNGKDNSNRDVPSGVYIYQIVASAPAGIAFQDQKKLALVR